MGWAATPVAMQVPVPGAPVVLNEPFLETS